MAKYNDLGYEQLLALRVMRDSPDLEGSTICKKADCSWDELFWLSKNGLIEAGIERFHLKQTHPKITNAGLAVLTDAEQTNEFRIVLRS